MGQPNEQKEFDFVYSEENANFYIQRAYELRHEAISQMMADARQGIAHAYHATANWLSEHLHRQPGSHA